MQDHPAGSPRFIAHPAVQLVGISAVSLFLELGMIRYINSTVQIVAYFNNLLVLSAFLGLGLGSMLTGRKRNFFTWMPLIFAVVLDLMAFLDGFHFGAVHADLVAWGVDESSGGNLPAIPVILAVFCANLAFFVPLGFRLGQCLLAFENRLVAYSWDLAGSILGVGIFSVWSWWGTPPWVWFALAAVVLLVWLWVAGAWQRSLFRFSIAALLFGAGVLFTLLPRRGTWSPYYKVATRDYPVIQTGEGKFVSLGFEITVDRLRIQDALHFSRELAATSLNVWIGYYQLPYLFRRSGRVLILGGGSGNDATVALLNGAEHVDVVEIDPVIAGMGYDRHPHRPYRDPRVRVIVDDARAFLRRNPGKYDLVVMNALDSHLQMPGLSTLRLESYVYTREAFVDAQRCLAPGALLIVHLSSSRPWMGERLYWSLAAAFGGREPQLFTTARSPYYSIAFVYGPDELLAPARLAGTGLIPVDPGPFQAARERTVLATDDWPHLYMSGKSIPSFYLAVLAAILLLVGIVFRLEGRLEVRGNLGLFLLGAGFMLLETRSLTKTALLFGSTWFVNAIVIASILVVVWLGNYWVQRGRYPGLRVAFPLLWAILLVQASVNEDWMLAASLPLRLVLVAGWIGLPILLAGFIFSQMFRATTQPARAFGANLMGAALGGALEYLSMIFGLGSLYIVAVVLYVLAALASGAYSRRTSVS